jgi:hypothetical protein
MRETNEENLEELLGQFLGAAQAKDAAGDIADGERIFGQFPAPLPQAAVIGDIKARISEAVARKKAAASRWQVLRFAAAAAVFVVLATVTIQLWRQGTSHGPVLASGSVVPRVIWDGEDIVADDAELATIAAEMEQIEGEILALEDGENGSDSYDDILELESELVAMEGDFWKG